MKNFIAILSLVCFSFNQADAQQFTVQGSELGAELDFSASTNGGNFGLGLKYGINIGEYLITGPSIRYSRTWVNNQVTGVNGGYNIYGGGAFVHARFFNALFLGVEFEMLKSPYAKAPFSGYLTTNGTWAPTLFLGGGFSMEFNEAVRVNLGIMYDVIDAENSPFRNSYKQITTAQGVPKFVPIIYRLAFFFPLTRK